MLVRQYARRIDAIALAKASGVTRTPALSLHLPKIPRFGLHGLAQVSLPTIWDAGQIPIDQTDAGVYGPSASVPIGTTTLDVPGIGPIDSQTISDVHKAVNIVTSWFGIGAGRHEADAIVPVQNQVTASWAGCVNAILTGQPCNLNTLNACYRYIWQGAVYFMQYVQQKAFTDGRASQQALNTVMPYIDGSCGYHWPPPMRPTQFNCQWWGGGTIGGNGQDGILGAIARAIRLCGGSGPPGVQPGPGGVLPHPDIPPGTQPPLIGGISSSNLLLVGAGVLALALYSRRSRG